MKKLKVIEQALFNIFCLFNNVKALFFINKFHIQVNLSELNIVRSV